MEHLFFSFWWLICPIFGMAMGFFGMISGFQNRRETLKMIQSYIDQGKEPPESLIKALNGSNEHQGPYEYHRHRNPRKRAFGGFIVFAALTAGFGWAGWIGNSHPLFQAVAIGFGVGAFGYLMAALFFSNPPRD